MSFLSVWVMGFPVIMVFLTVLWLISVILKNASIIDPFWGLGYIILVFYYQSQTKAFELINWILIVLVAIWGLRLFLYLLVRNSGKGEDYRYQEFRKDFGPKRYWWISFFQVFLLQGVLMMIVSLPLLGALFSNSGRSTSIIIYLAALVFWLIGFLFETVADYQLSHFKKTSQPGELLKSGLWRYTRHPNYFGDAMVWWGFGLFSVANGYYWPVIGSLVMTILLMRVSGVTLLERKLRDSKPQYKKYIQQTPAFFPWVPKKTA